MKKIISLTITFLLLHSFSCSPDEKITLSDLYSTVTFEVTNYDTLIQAVKTVNDAIYLPSLNRYYLVGNDDERNFFTCHIDEEYNVTEYRQHGGPANDFAHEVMKSEDDYVYVVGGSRSNTAGQNDFMLVKTTLFGEEIWNNKYGTINCDPISGGIINENNEVVLVGGTMRANAPLCTIEDNYVIVVNPESEDTIKTSRFLDESGASFSTSQTIQAIAEVETGRYLLLYSQDGTTGINDFLFIATSDDLCTLNDRQELGRSALINSHSEIIDYRDEMLIFTMITKENNDNDILIFKTDMDGNIQASSAIESDCNESFRDYLLLNDGSILVAGSINEGPGKQYMLVCKLNPSLGVEWCAQYELGYSNIATKLLNFNQDEVKVIGYTYPRNVFSPEVVSFEISTIDGSVIN